jgi:hypothetical protein
MRAGFTSFPPQVYSLGICSLFLKAGLDIFNTPIPTTSLCRPPEQNKKIQRRNKINNRYLMAIPSLPEYITHFVTISLAKKSPGVAIYGD